MKNLYGKNLIINIIFLFTVVFLTVFNPSYANQTVVDSFTRDVSSGWGMSSSGSVWTTSGSEGNYLVVNGKGKIILAGGESSRKSIIGSDSLDTEVLAKISWNVEPTSSYIYGGFILRNSNGNNFYYTRVKNSNGKVTIVLDKVINGSGTVLGSVTLSIPFEANTDYNLRFVALGTSPTNLKAKLWPVSQEEPKFWSISIVDNEPLLQTPGKVGVRAGAGSGYVGTAHFYVDNFSSSCCGEFGYGGEKGEKGDTGDQGEPGNDSGIFVITGNTSGGKCMDVCLNSQSACIRGIHNSTNNSLGKVGVTFECSGEKTSLQPFSCVCMNY